MLKGISESLNVLQRNQTVAPAPTAVSDSQPARIAPSPSISSHRLASYQKWAKVTQGQHAISANQVAEQGLLKVSQLLKKLQQPLQKSSSQTGLTESQSESAKQIQQQLIAVDISYQQQPLVDHQFNLINANRPAAKHYFQLKSVDLLGVKTRDERITVQYGDQHARAHLPAHQNSLYLAKQLTTAFKDIGIAVQAPARDSAMLSTNHQNWQQIQSGLLMSGQGQRLPAGDARTVKVVEILSWQDPKEWRFSTPQDIKQTAAKVAKTQQKVNQQIGELRSSQLNIQQQLKRAHQHQLQQGSVEHSMAKLNQLMQPTPFYSQVTSLMAQANVSRDHVSSILKD
ncbi:hypothetical protein [Shewanella sp. 10N.286.48.A6]|uniref:hypothetical protein n=1 Tax=Shewanella sp. 10N.286.48.A6 TaxID=1880833 RepID=UPI000C831B2C|nr:hypothetical protein [Shewanella sp. 10N.286.48.A6]PMH98564.1 hypothetical protein BCU55_15495 [Shewanella sp. 10N.286.48.A6]